MSTPVLPNDRSSPPPIQTALALLARGLSPIPVPFRSKKPVLPGWPDLRITAETADRYFGIAPSNIGVLWGQPSGWAIDIDIDHPDALALADEILPPTGMVYGRDGSPRSHRIYRLSRPAKNQVWEIPGLGTVIELRGDRLQSIAPGSVHEDTGELVRWDSEGDPATVDPDVLIARIEVLIKRLRAMHGIEEPQPSIHDILPALSIPGYSTGPGLSYGPAALAYECAEVAASTEPGRNNRLNIASFKMGTLIGAGHLDRAEAECGLAAAAAQCGLSEREAAATIRSGIEAGIKEPRQLPEALALQHAASSPPAKRNAPPACPLTDLVPLTIPELMTLYPNQREAVIDGLLRQGEVMNLIAAPKTGKTWSVHALAVCVAAGRPWLGFKTHQGNVLICDAELHPESITYRLMKTGDAMGLLDEHFPALHVLPLRGKGYTLDDIELYVAKFPVGTYRLLIVDAMYRFVPRGLEENSNEDMTQVYTQLDRIAAISGASIVVVHHSSKGNQSDKGVTDMGSGAGAQSRAADTHMVLRPHEEEGAVSVHMVVRGFKPVDAFVIRITNPGWKLEPSLDPEKLRKPKRAKKQAEADDKAPPKPTKLWTPKTFAREIVGKSGLIKEDILATANEDHGLSKVQAQSFLERAEEHGFVRRDKGCGSSKHRFRCVVAEEELLSTPQGETSKKNHLPPSAASLGGVGGKDTPPSPPSAHLGGKGGGA
jgi:hypothetical protein